MKKSDRACASSVRGSCLWAERLWMWTERTRGRRLKNNVAPFVAVAVVAVEEVSSILNIKQKKRITQPMSLKY